MWPSFKLCHQNLLMALILSTVIVTIEASTTKTTPDLFNSIGDQFKMDNHQPVITDGRLKFNMTPEIQLDVQNNSQTNTSIDPEWINQVDWSAVWPYFNTGCMQWLPINHVYFQLANGFLFLSYLAPAGLYGLIYLRIMLAIGSAFLSIWGWIIICAFDTFLWNAFFFFINAVHAVVLLISLRPITFDDQVQQVYETIFQPLKMSKQQLKKVAKCIRSIEPLKRGEYFAVEQETLIETLSLLLSGTMLVIDKGQTLYVVSPMQFLDSPEWFDSSDIFQVSIQACEESRILLWHRDKLQSILQKDISLQSIFNQILGQDVTRKLCEASRNTKIVKSKCYAEVKLDTNGMYNENGKSNNRKLSDKETMRNSCGSVSSEQLSLLNETIFAPYRSITNLKIPQHDV